MIRFASVLTLSLALSLAPAALADERQGTPKGAKVKIELKDVNGNKAHVNSKILGIGYVRPFVPRQRVKVWVARAAKKVTVKRQVIKQVPGKNQGTFQIRSDRLLEDGTYRVRARKKNSPEQKAFHAESRGIGIRYPDLDPGMKSNDVELFNDLLQKEGYYTSNGRSYDAGTERAVLAYRKVNGMERIYNATPDIFKKLASGKGGYDLRYPGKGKHVETDLSRQVMVLANHGKPQHTFHISSGTRATPTIQGHHVFTRKQYGTNSHGMVHSVYFGPTNRGYATHGYKSVPNYPASHGCLRNPIPNSLFIYNWISLGDDIYVYP